MSAVSTEISNVSYPNIDCGTDFSSDESQLSQLSIVSRRPGVHNILPAENFEEAAIFPTESDLDDYDIENESVINVTDLELSSSEHCKEVKSGTLKRILRNLTRSSKSELHMEKTEPAKSSSLEPDIKEGKTPENEESDSKETNVSNSSESTPKGSRTNISKALHKLSGVFSRSKTDEDKSDSSKQDLREEKYKRNSLSRRLSNISAHLMKDNNSKHDVVEEKDKRNSLSRRLSNISAHLPKLSNQKAETTSLDNQSDENQSDCSKSDSKTDQVKRCPIEKKSSTLSKRLSSIGSHFRSRGVPNPCSGEAENVGDTKIEENNLELNEKKEGDIKVEENNLQLNEKKEIG